MYYKAKPQKKIQKSEVFPPDLNLFNQIEYWKYMNNETTQTSCDAFVKKYFIQNKCDVIGWLIPN